MPSPVVNALRVLVPALPLLALATAGLAGPVSLVATTDASIRFQVSVPETHLVPDSTVSPPVLRLQLDGFDGGLADAPGLPGRMVMVAVPALGDVAVSAAASEPEAREGVALAGLPGAAPPGFVPGVRAKLLGVSWMRNQRVASVAVYPADYDAAARRLVLYRRIDVTVQVQPSGSLGPPAEDPDPFERAYRDGLLNYEQGRAWRRPATRRLVGRAALEPAQVASIAAAVPESSVYAGRSWLKIAVTKAGFYQVSFNELRNFAMFANLADTARFDDLRLFTWPGVPVLPEQSYCDSCDFREVAIGTIDHGGDGYFDMNTDAFYFYAMGPSDWASLYDPAQPETVYVDHPYDTHNYYYLTRSTKESPVAGTPARIVVEDGTVTDTTLAWPVTYPARAHWEQDNPAEYYPDASPLFQPSLGGATRQWYEWEKWFWKSIGQGGAFSVTEPLPGADTSQVWLRALVWGLSNDSHRVDVSFNDQAFPLRTSNSYTAMVFESTFIHVGTLANTFRVSVPARSGVADVNGFAWLELYYRRDFEPVDDELAFDSPDSARSVDYRVGPFTRLVPPRVFDVTRACAPIEIVGARFDTLGGRGWLRFHAEESARRRYRVIQDSLAALPQQSFAEAPATSLENLRSSSEEADYIVIYYDGFATAANLLTGWRTDHLPLPGVDPPYHAKAIPVSALYDQFSGGRVDPAAIRNFLRAAFYNWNGGGVPRRPAFVTILGGASYDFKNLKGRARPGQPGCLVPTYENNFDHNLIVLKQFATDDWLLNVDDSRTIIPDFYGGRLPLDDAASAVAVVNSKVIGYESQPALGDWRNALMLIADDNMQGIGRPDGLGWYHVHYTADLDDLTPVHMDRDYVYEHKYETTPSNTKPEAKADILRFLNSGVALVNFVGHGSPFQLADEKVLVNADVGTLSNAPRLPLFVAASCDVGKFSDPVTMGLGQAMIMNPQGGAVGVISSTELAFSPPNATLNNTIFRELFTRDTTDCHYHVPIAAALLATKTGQPNEMKYQLLGDAAIRLALPRLWVEVSVTDTLGNPVTAVRRGQTLVAHGQVRTCPDGDPVPLGGAASLRIDDSQPVETVTDGYNVFSYRYRAGTVYQGDVGLANGQFTERFIVPLEARDGTLGRVRAYVQGRSPGETADTDGAGSLTTAVTAPGAGDTTQADHAGPRITLSFVGGSTTVRPDATLRIDLYDPSGILTTDHAPQNGIVVTLDGNATTRKDVTESFRYAANSYQSGAAYYQLTGTPLGPHTVTVSAADNMAAGLTAGANRSKASLGFTVIDQPELRIAHAYLFPNPTQSNRGGGGGQFVVDAPGDSINALLRIYTVSGRLIRTLKSFGGLGQVQIPWDGLDDEGDPLANGTYFFRVHINPRDADGTSSPDHKADADGRFVILNRR